MLSLPNLMLKNQALPQASVQALVPMRTTVPEKVRVYIGKCLNKVKKTTKMYTQTHTHNPVSQKNNGHSTTNCGLWMFQRPKKFKKMIDAPKQHLQFIV